MLSAEIKTVFFQSALLMVLLRFMLSVFSFGTIRRHVVSFIANQNNAVSQRKKCSRRDIVVAVKLASKYFLATNRCLIESIVLWGLFKRQGYPANLRIGIRKDAGAALNAHAWVESEGIIAIGWLPDLSRFILLPPLKWEKVG